MPFRASCCPGEPALHNRCVHQARLLELKLTSREHGEIGNAADVVSCRQARQTFRIDLHHNSTPSEVAGGLRHVRRRHPARPAPGSPEVRQNWNLAVANDLVELLLVDFDGFADCRQLRLAGTAERRGKRKTKPHVTPEQFEQLLALIPEPYASMVYVAVWTGLRVSELIGLKWEDVGTDSLTIDERCCRGDWDAPKSEASNATIGVEPCVIERINRLKQLTVDVKAGRSVRHYKVVKSDRPEDLVFQSVRSGVPMRDNNILSRHIKPAARKLGLPWINWRCLRTSHATWMVEAGANPKDVQGQMRHSRISTTMDIYAQFVPESQRRALAKMSAMVEARTSKPIAPASTVSIATPPQSRMVN